MAKHVHESRIRPPAGVLPGEDQVEDLDTEIDAGRGGPFEKELVAEMRALVGEACATRERATPIAERDAYPEVRIDEIPRGHIDVELGGDGAECADLPTVAFALARPAVKTEVHASADRGEVDFLALDIHVHQADEGPRLDRVSHQRPEHVAVGKALRVGARRGECQEESERQQKAGVHGCLRDEVLHGFAA